MHDGNLESKNGLDFWPVLFWWFRRFLHVFDFLHFFSINFINEVLSMEQSNDLLGLLRLSFHDERIGTFRHYSENNAYNDDQNGKEVNTDNNMPSDNLI